MSKQNTKATIDAYIKQNGRQAITGQILNGVLNTMVNDYAEESRLETLEQGLSIALPTLQSELDSTKGRVTTAEGNITEQGAKLTDLERNVVGVKTWSLQEKGEIVNKDNILPDFRLSSAVSDDVHTEILDGYPSKIIHISNSESGMYGAFVDVGNIFNPIVAGTYHLHFKVKIQRNAAYAYQPSMVQFQYYLNNSFKGANTINPYVPTATPSDNDFVEYVKDITFAARDAPFNRLKICSNTKFEYWIKDLYITKDADDSEGYEGDLIKFIKGNKTSKSLSVIGDSLSDPLIHFADKWHYDLAINNGYTIDCVAVSGSGYFNGSLRGGTQDHQFYNQANRIKKDTDMVLVFGGFNDLSKLLNGDVTLGTKTDSGTSTIGGCVNTMLDNLYSINVGMKIGIVTPTPWQGMNPMIASNNPYYPYVWGVYNLLKEICEYRSIPFLDLFLHSGLRPWVAGFRSKYYIADNDGTHPNAKGQKEYIYPKMREFLRALNWDNI